MNRMFFLLAGIIVLSLVSLPGVSVDAAVDKVTYEDLSGRFALELPEGWKLVKEQLSHLYIFGKDGVSVKLLLAYSDGVSDLAEIFSDAVEMATGNGLTPPPAGGVADMTLNGSPARWTEYASTIAVEKRTATMHVFVGAVISPGHQAGISFFAFMKPEDHRKFSDPLRASWESLRLHGKPLTGVKEVVEVDSGTLQAAKKAPEPSVFEHKLITLALPAGWVGEQGKDSGILAKLKHEKFGSVTIMGGPKNEFGKNRDLILNGIRDGLMTGIPSMKSTRGSWVVPTAGCGEAAIEQYEGVIVAAGREFPRGALLVATKDGRRGIGFMATFNSDVKEAAVNDILKIIISAK